MAPTVEYKSGQYLYHKKQYVNVFCDTIFLNFLCLQKCILMD